MVKDDGNISKEKDEMFERDLQNLIIEKFEDK